MGLFSPVTDAIGMTSPEVAKLEEAKRIDSTTNPYGTTTNTGYTPAVNPNQGNVDAARLGMTGVLEGGLGAGQDRLNAFQDSYIADRQPALDRNLAQQQQAQNIQSDTRMTAGGSSDLTREALMNQFANEQQGQLLNQAIQGREGLANQALNQDVARANLYGGIGQQDFNNQMAGFGAGQQQFGASQGREFDFSNQANQIENARVQQANDARYAGFNALVGAGTAVATGYDAFGKS
jgi:hypothetical protein